MSTIVPTSNAIVHNLDGELRVSSLVVAERTGNQHASVLRIVRDNQGDFETFGQVRFQIRPGYNNAPVSTAHLNEPQATLLMTFMRNSEIVKAFKVELVTQFYQMRQALTAQRRQLTPDEIVHQALQITAAKVQELEAKVQIDAPKVTYIDTYVADNDLRIFRNVAKQLGITEKQLREELIKRKWIYKETTTRWSEKRREKQTVCRYSPYSTTAHMFVPVPNHEAPRFKGEVMHTLKITPQGAAMIARLYRNGAAA